MKNRLISVLLAAGAALCARGDTWADPDTGYTWTYQINGDTAEIYNGGSPAITPSPTGAVVIPATLDGKPVTSIGPMAFNGSSALTSVTIPDSVMSIGYEVFSGCSDSLFDTTTIPGVVLVDGWAVGNTGSLSGNLNLTGARGIGSSAFSDCTNLTSVTMPDSVTGIGSHAFSGCSGFTSVTIPGSVMSIGSYAFHGCTNLTSVTIPQYVLDCQIRNVFSMGRRPIVAITSITDISFSSTVTNIGESAFYGCSGLTNVTIPDSVTSIGYSAFYNCSGLTNVTIPDSVTSIGYSAFYNCSGLTSVTIPDSVTVIGGQAFSGCSGLTSVTIPDSVTVIGSDAFANCSGLTSVTIPDNVTSIGSSAFSGCSDSLFDTTTIPGVVLVDGWAVGNTGSLSGNLNLTGVRGIGDSAFSGCRGLTSVKIPDSVTSIGVCAFSGCSGLTSMTIPDSVTSIGQEAFFGCSGLTSVTIPASVTSFGANCFEGCPVYMRKLYQTILGAGAGGGSASVNTTIVQQVEAPYTLTDHVADRAIASVTVSGDTALGSFVLADGKVYDSVLYVVNTATAPVRLSLPAGHTYVTVSGLAPLLLPASSTNLVTITRMAADTFLVTRQSLEAIK